MSSQNLRSIIIDFTNDLTKVFPEYAFLWEKWLTADDAEYEKLNQHFMAVFPERFFDIMNSNMEIFTPDSEANVMFLPDVDFKLLFNCAGVSEGTKTSMWKYLQLLLFTVLGDMKDTANFGETMNMFESMDENDLQEKMKETMDNLSDFFKGFDSTNEEGSVNEGPVNEGPVNEGPVNEGPVNEGPTNESATSDEGSGFKLPKGFNVPKGFKLPKPEIIQEHMKILMEGKLGKLAKELTEEFTGDLKDVFDETDKDKSMKEIMAQLMKDPKKIMGIMKKITDKLQNKMQNGDISQDELMKEVASLVEKFKEMGGGEDFMKNFTSGPFAKMFKNMAGGMAGGGASANQMMQMGKQSAMKDRLRKKMEERKMREALQSQASQSQAQTQTQQLTQGSSKNIVVKIGDEKQEKSGLRPPATNALNAVPQQSSNVVQSTNVLNVVPLNEDELIALFKSDKKKKKGKK
jgi:hypothetical protein